MQGKSFSLLIALILCISPSLSWAQDDGYGAREEADHYFQKQGYFAAVDLYKKAYGQEKSADEKAALIFMVAESYRMLNDQVQAEVWYLRAIKARHDDVLAYYHLGQALQAQGRLAEAREEFNRFKEKGGSSSMADQAISSLEVAAEMNENKSKYVVDPEVMLNTEYYEFSPILANPEGNMLYFSSSRLGSTGVEEFKKTGESYEDIFFSQQDKKGKWSEPQRLPLNVNTDNNEGSPVFTSDFVRMYYTKCMKAENTGCKIYETTRTGETWTDAKEVKLATPEQKENTFGHPTLSQDNKMMVFASDIPGGKGGKDLWYSLYNDASNSWGSPVNMASVNTAGDEMFPHLRKNGALYFATNGIKGMGGLDIFSAEKTGDNEWGNAKNMGSPINTIADDFGMIFQGDLERGYLTSNRTGGKGKDDIYIFSLPEVVFAFEGIVYDKDGQFPIDAAYVRVFGSDGSSFETLTDVNGGFSFAENGEDRFVNPEVNYSIEVGKEEYLVAKDNVSTVGLGESTTFVKEFLIQSTKVDEISFPEVQYDLGKFTLRPESKDSLNYLYQTLVDNPTIVIELAAHTDSRGSNQANQTLSEDRAKSCVEYLVSKGIAPARMKAKGYGENKLRVSDAKINALPAAEREAAHQKNRRTVFSVLSWDYMPN